MWQGIVIDFGSRPSDPFMVTLVTFVISPKIHAILILH